MVNRHTRTAEREQGDPLNLWQLASRFAIGSTLAAGVLWLAATALVLDQPGGFGLEGIFVLIALVLAVLLPVIEGLCAYCGGMIRDGLDTCPLTVPPQLWSILAGFTSPLVAGIAAWYLVRNVANAHPLSIVFAALIFPPTILGFLLPRRANLVGSK